MTKSFKMVLLRVLLDNDAVFSGMPIPELAARFFRDFSGRVAAG
jgi:hypothetical protein